MGAALEVAGWRVWLDRFCLDAGLGGRLAGAGALRVLARGLGRREGRNDWVANAESLAGGKSVPIVQLARTTPVSRVKIGSFSQMRGVLLLVNISRVWPIPLSLAGGNAGSPMPG